MVSRDFFSFCTSLKPLELKALGELSEVVHLVGGETIYQVGDPGDALFIINRGMVEVVQENASSVAPGTYLSRGDVFGDVEMLTNIPRSHHIRTCEEVSLRCFRADDLSELLKRVPSFFRYLSEHLAGRLLQARDVAVARSRCLELSGSLANFDLITVFQTIVTSSQTGELLILDDKRELICAFFFEAGQPRGGQFQHLTGEEAFWQLFLSEDIQGTFSFSSKEAQVSHSIKRGLITRSPDDMLINALQMCDEFQAIKAKIPSDSAILERARPELFAADIAEDLRPLAEQIWQLSPGRKFSVRAFYPHLGVCELKIYQGVSELLRTRHFTMLAPVAAENFA